MSPSLFISPLSSSSFEVNLLELALKGAPPGWSQIACERIDQYKTRVALREKAETFVRLVRLFSDDSALDAFTAKIVELVSMEENKQQPLRMLKEEDDGALSALTDLTESRSKWMNALSRANRLGDFVTEPEIALKLESYEAFKAQCYECTEEANERAALDCLDTVWSRLSGVFSMHSRIASRSSTVEQSVDGQRLLQLVLQVDSGDSVDRLATAISDANNFKSLLDEICLRSFGDSADMAKTRVRDIVITGTYDVDKDGELTCRIEVPDGEEIVHDFEALARLESELILLVSEQGGQGDEVRLYPKRHEAVPVPVMALKQFHVETLGTLRVYAEAKRELAAAGCPVIQDRPDQWRFSVSDVDLWSQCCKENSTVALQIIRESLVEIVSATTKIRQRTEEWKCHVEEQRLQSYALNFYTMQQIQHIFKDLKNHASPLSPRCERLLAMACHHNTDAATPIIVAMQRDMKEANKNMERDEHMLECVSNVAQVIFERALTQPFAWDEAELSTDVLSPGKVSVLPLPTSRKAQLSCLDLFRRVQGHPTGEFALICQGNTSEEEVRIFLYRAFLSINVYSSRAVYAILHAEKLSAQVQSAAVECIQNFEKEFTSAIVIFCQTCQEDMRESVLLAAFPSDSSFQPADRLSTPDLELFLPRAAIARASVVEDRLLNTMTPSGNGKTTMILREASDNGLLVDTIALHGQHTEHSICQLLRSQNVLVENLKSDLAAMGCTDFIPGQLDGLLIKNEWNVERAVGDFFSTGCEAGLDDLCVGKLLHFDLGSDFDCDEWSSIVFKLLLQKRLTDNDGDVHFLHSDRDFVRFEVAEGAVDGMESRAFNSCRDFEMYGMIPRVTTVSPDMILEGLEGDIDCSSFETMWQSNNAQFAAKWIKKMSEVKAQNDEDAADVEISTWMKTLVEGENLSPADSLGTLIQFCRDAEVEYVTWKHLNTLITFLSGPPSKQTATGELHKLVGNPFIVYGEDPGFTRCVANLILKSAATNINTLKLRVDTLVDPQSNDLAALNMTSDRPWEASDRPWLLFNSDGTSMCFLGFKIDPQGRLLNAGGQPGERIMSATTYAFLRSTDNHNGDFKIIVDDVK
jgi:hypothetical protein